MEDLQELREWLWDQIQERQDMIGPRSLSPSDSAWLSASYAVVMRIDETLKYGRFTTEGGIYG